MIHLLDFSALFALSVCNVVFCFPFGPAIVMRAENTHLYFSACLFSASPNRSIILLKWAILAWIFVVISFMFENVTSVLAAGIERADLLLQFSFLVDIFCTFGRLDWLSLTRAQSSSQ